MRPQTLTDVPSTRKPSSLRLRLQAEADEPWPNVCEVQKNHANPAQPCANSSKRCIKRARSITGRSGVSRPSWCTSWCKAHLPEGLTSEIVGFLGTHNKWLLDLDSNQDSRSQSPDCLGEFANRFCKLSSQAARFCQRVAANLQAENPCVTRRLDTGLLVENGARKQTLRFAVREPW